MNLAATQGLPLSAFFRRVQLMRQGYRSIERGHTALGRNFECSVFLQARQYIGPVYSDLCLSTVQETFKGRPWVDC
jgi:hypothetical protein